MAATLEQFKQAFDGQVAVDPLLKTDRATESALKELKGKVQSLDKAAPRTERFQTALVDLVKRYSNTKQGNGRPHDTLGQELEQIHRETLAQIDQVRGGGDDETGRSDTSSDTCQADDGDHDGGGVCEGPPIKGDAARYTANLQSIQKDLDAALKPDGPDKASRDVQTTLRSTVSRMNFAAMSGDYDQANVELDELPGLVEDYKQKVAAYNKRDKAARAAQDAFEKRYDELRWELQVVIKFKSPNAEATAIQDEIIREKELLDLAVLEANFAKANTHLNKIVDAWNRFADNIKQHNLAITAQQIKEAPKRAYEANLNGIKNRLDALTKNAPAPKDPDAPLLKKIAELKKQLQEQVSVKEPDYAAANKLVDEIRGQITQYDLKQAARQKAKEDAAEAKAKSTYPADLQAIDYVIEFHYEISVGGGAPWDKQAIAILDKLIKARALFKQQEPYFNYRSRQAEVDSMKALVAAYKAANVAAWKGVYEKSRAMISKSDLETLLDAKQWPDDALKGEQRKLKVQNSRMERAETQKDYYDAALQASLLNQEFLRVKKLTYKTAGPDGKETIVRPRLLGRPVAGPSANTLLMLLNKEGSGAIAHSEGAKLNKDGIQLLKTWDKTTDLQTQWTKGLESAKKEAAKVGSALANVDRAVEAIKNGAGGDRLLKAIKEYTNTEKLAVAKLRQLNAKFLLYDKSIKEHNGAIMQQAERAAKRTKSNADAKRDEEAKSIEDKKGKIKQAFGMASSLLFPVQWLSVGKVIGFIAAELGAEALVSTSKLEQLQKEAEVATKELEKIEDKIDLNTIEVFVKAVAAAQEELQSVKTELEAMGDSLDFAEREVVSAMKTSAALTEAAKAVEMRGVFESAKRSLALYLEETAGLAVDIIRVKDAYVSFSRSFQDPAPGYAASVTAAADGNATALRDFSAYLKSVQPEAEKGLAFISKGDDDRNTAGFYRIMPKIKIAVLNRKP